MILLYCSRHFHAFCTFKRLRTLTLHRRGRTWGLAFLRRAAQNGGDATHTRSPTTHARGWLICLLTSLYAAFQPQNHTGLFEHPLPTTNPHNRPGCQRHTKAPCYYNPPQDWGGHKAPLWRQRFLNHAADNFHKILFRCFCDRFSSDKHPRVAEGADFTDCTFLSEGRGAEYETPAGSLSLRH